MREIASDPILSFASGMSTGVFGRVPKNACGCNLNNDGLILKKKLA